MHSNEYHDQIVALLPRLRRFALSLTSNKEDADDLVQAACERALSRQHQWQPGTRLDSWLFRIIQIMASPPFTRGQEKIIIREGWKH
ncbi:MAG: hypothetical protein JRI80_16075 [Deltaproteobacteria bacterium]|nr:hypothetical protein [Deltaproteobacteria bacterium]